MQATTQLIKIVQFTLFFNTIEYTGLNVDNNDNYYNYKAL